MNINQKLTLTALVLAALIGGMSHAKADVKIVYKNHSGISHFGPGLSHRYHKNKYAKSLHKHHKHYKFHKRKKYAHPKIIHHDRKFFYGYYNGRPFYARYGYVPRKHNWYYD